MPFTAPQLYEWVIRTMESLGISFDDALAITLRSLPDHAELLSAIEAAHRDQGPQPDVLSADGKAQGWSEEYSSASGYYWQRQRVWLCTELKRSVAELEALDKASDFVLSYLPYPGSEGPERFNTRGLVIGYVQSGKTANYTAVAAKAADLGYKLIIVLSGVHNALRLQTQRRLNAALGVDGTGVKFDPDRHLITLTSSEPSGDFRSGSLGLFQGNNQVLLVVKKNVPVLRRLREWLMGARIPMNLPVLIIDDECDQATINTGGNRFAQNASFPETSEEEAEEDTAPSPTNEHIRGLCNTFPRCAYVAYTATPFANLLIDHQAVDREVESDLYPKDFIIALPEQEGYFGARRLFGREDLPEDENLEPGLPICRIIPDPDARVFRPAAKDIETADYTLPTTLKLAVIDFLLASAARIVTEGENVPLSMLVHVNFRVDVQTPVTILLKEYVESLRLRWKFELEPRELEQELQARWESDFQDTCRQMGHPSLKFSELAPGLLSILRSPLRVETVNYFSEVEVDFDKEPYFRGILVGGNRFTRGITIEGLLVSYFSREAGAYDTLMQMGRWFGFRDKYVQFTRIWTTQSLWSRFREVALAEDEMRGAINRNARAGLTPLQAGVRIRQHPGILVTSKAKQGAGVSRRVSYSGELEQTVRFPFADPSALSQNLQLTSNFLRALGEPHPVDASHPNFTWTAVPGESVLKYLSYFQSALAGRMDFHEITRFVQGQLSRNNLLNWCVSVRGRIKADPQLGVEELMGIPGTPVARINRSVLLADPSSIGALITPATLTKPEWSGDEEIGLSIEAIRRAKLGSHDNESFQRALRGQRLATEGLLLLYPISPNSTPGENNRRRAIRSVVQGELPTIVGVAVVFPHISDAPAVSYMVGSVVARD